jgi:predicted DNA-binding protein with PD1-like motif
MVQPEEGWVQYATYGTIHVLRIDEGEEAVATIRDYLVEQSILAGYFVAWGAFSRLKLEFFEPRQGEYRERTFDEQLEVASLLGNIACLDGEPVVHAHLTVGDREFRTYSGHLAEGIVRPMLEVFVTPLPGELPRVRDARTNLAVLAPGVAPEALEAIGAERCRVP